MRIVAFDAESGDEVVWSRKDTPHIDDLVVRVRASSTMPGLMPPVHFEGHVYVDGAMGRTVGSLSARLNASASRISSLSSPRNVGTGRHHNDFQPSIEASSVAIRCWGEALLTRWKRYNETQNVSLPSRQKARCTCSCPNACPSTTAPAPSRVSPPPTGMDCHSHGESYLDFESSSERSRTARTEGRDPHYVKPHVNMPAKHA